MTVFCEMNLKYLLTSITAFLPMKSPSAVHSGAASGLRTFLANVVISAAGLELVPPLSSDLKTVFGLNFKQVEREI